MYKIILIASIVVFCACREEQSLKNGDLLFQANEPSELTNAIEGAGAGYNNYTFSHVGIVCTDNGDTNVIEAVPDKGVTLTPLRQFLSTSAKDKNGKPLVCIARLLPQYANLTNDAVKRAKSLKGKTYDSVFLPDNDAYYCSELVEKSFLDKMGNPIFESKPMSFKDKTTGEFYPAWIEFFAAIKMPIPEGVIGTNPNDMSKSKTIRIWFKTN
jgi:uncharacterized protein YycO